MGLFGHANNRAGLHKNFISYAIENIITVWSTWDVQLWYGGVYIVLYFSRKKLDDGSKTEL